MIAKPEIDDVHCTALFPSNRKRFSIGRWILLVDVYDILRKIPIIRFHTEVDFAKRVGFITVQPILNALNNIRVGVGRHGKNLKMPNALIRM